ncbi:MAG: trigger factor [Flavobacteriales bacterium]|nr:trigger factor [Flavobacteriales bacterium]
MEITQNNIDKLNAKLTIKLGKEDYDARYNEALKTARKSMSLPGFRPGHVPMSLVKKKYGAAVLAEELNTLLSDKINEHVRENNLHLLGQPLPVEKKGEGDFENPSDFEFEYEMGLAPEFDLNLDKFKVTYHTIKVDDKLVDKQIQDMAKRYGRLTEPDASEDSDLLMTTLIELDENDEIKEGGMMSDATVSIEFVEDKKTKKALTGLKKNDEIVVDPHKISKGHDDLARMLNTTHEAVHHIHTNFKLRVNEVKRLIPSDINQELFDKVFGKDAVKDEAEFRTRVQDDMTNHFKGDETWLFKREASRELVDGVKMELPDEFLKRWIHATNENPINDSDLDKEYPAYAKGLKWQLIMNRILDEHQIRVESEEVMNHAKENIASQFAQYGMPIPDEELEKYAANMLQNQEEVRKIFDRLYEDKVIDKCRELMKVKDKEVAYDDFVKLVNEQEH